MEYVTNAESIMRAGAALLEERGPYGITIALVAARAGVSTALVHYHFGSLDTLRARLAAEARETKNATACRWLDAAGL